MCKRYPRLSAVALWGLTWSACGDRVLPRPAEPAQKPAELPPDAKGRLDLYVREDLDAELAYSPTLATWLGMHGYDDRIDDVRAEAQVREALRCKGVLEHTRALDDRELDALRRLDKQLLERRCQHTLLELTELRPLERNPLAYVDLAQSAVAELVAEDQVPLPDRARALTARLWKIRPLLDEARRNLRSTAPELAVRKAVELAQSARSFLVETLPKAVQLSDPKLMDDFRAANGDASRALDDFAGWLQKDLQPRARGEFALGRDRFMERLRLSEALDPEVTAEQLLALGERELKESRRRYDDAVKQLQVGKPAVDVSKLIEDDHGKPDDLQREAQAAVEAMVAWVRNNKLVTLPNPERPRVVDMPPAQWGFAQLSIAGPLDRPRDAYLYIDPIDKSWPDRRKQEHLKAFNRSVMALTLMHEVLGHFLQQERDRRAPTTMQKIALAGTLVEGWPHYVERMMVEQGYGGGDPKLRIAVERSVLLRAGRLVAAVKLHAFGAKLDDVTKLLIDEALLEDYQARREAERAALEPMVLVDTLGRLQIEKLRDDWRAANAGAPLGAFHDALLGHGSIPVATIAKLR